MAVFSPNHKSLYRTLSGAVILITVAAVVSTSGQAQYSKRTASKGPRALGLLELASNGNAHLIPITILSEGRFYDAGAYKASPVPMALEPQTVYEALRTGVSQGLFTISDARELKNTNTWIADGSYLPAGAAPPKKTHEAEAKPNMGENDAPPTLRRGEKPNNTGESTQSSGPKNSAPPQGPPQTSAPSTSAPTASAPAGSGQGSAPASSSSNNPATSSTSSSGTSASSTANPAPEADKNRPVLHRGKPTAKDMPVDEDTIASVTPAKKPASAGKTSAPLPGVGAGSNIQLLPAISDADGPDPRPYTYDIKPEEEQKYRQKILALASEEVRTRARELEGAQVGSSPARGGSPRAPSAQRKAAPPQPTFDDVQLRLFDLSTSNEPILVLTATARMPRSAGFVAADSEPLQYFITLVARADIYGDLRKLFTNVTDTRHLDAIPRMELIDAVDVDGDGRGELLFRQISDAGTAFDVYRVTGDQLWPLFEGTPQ